MTISATPDSALRRSAPEPPPATRHRPPTWRNPRILVGIVLVAASVLIGARLMAAADDTVGVWVAARDLPLGSEVAADDLRQAQIRFSEDQTRSGYLLASEAVPGDVVLSREVRAGELVPHSALAAAGANELVELPLSVAPDDLPATVRKGSVVDVWVAPSAAAAAGARGGGPRATRVLTDVAVVSVPSVSEGFGAQTTRQVIVGLEDATANALGAPLAAISEGRVVIARKQ